MKLTKNYYNDIIHVLQELKKDFPSYSLGTHLSAIIYEYNDIWGLSDKEFLFALEKYKTSLELDLPHPSSDIDNIINDAMDLNNILNDGEAE